MTHTMLADNTIVGQPPLVVEIVGPECAGKTTLLQALNQPRIKILAGVRIRKINYIALAISNIPSLLATFLRQYRHSRRLTYNEAKLMLRLKVWHHFLSRQPPNNNTVIVCDHGPITTLVMLHRYCPEEKSLDRLLNQWASTLDMVICLDAPVATLVERIQKRNKRTRVTEKSEQETYTILERTRRFYEEISAKMTANGCTRVLYFDTEQESLNQIAEKVLAEFDQESSQG